MNFQVMSQLKNILILANHPSFQEPILDVKFFGYDLQEVQELFHSLGEEGRQIYLHQQLALDLFYPLFFLLGFAQFFLEMIKRSVGSIKIAQVGFWLTLFGSFSDWSENMLIFLQLKNFPQINDRLVILGSSLTVTKLFLILMVQCLFVYFCYLFIRQRSQSSA